MKKILLLIFIVLIILTLSELGYYIYVQYRQYPSQLMTPNQFDTEKITTPFLSQQKEGIPPVKIINDYNNPDQAINDKTLSQWYTVLRWYKKGLMRSSVLTNEFAGEIEKINKEGGVFTQGGEGYDGVEYKVSIVLKSKDYSNWFFFKKEDLQNIKVFQSVGGKETPLDIYQLNVGDTIQIKELIDLTRNFESSLIEFKIVKLKL